MGGGGDSLVINDQIRRMKAWVDEDIQEVNIVFYGP